MTSIEPVCLSDFELIAKQKLPKGTYDFFKSGADEEITSRRNEQAFKKY